MKDWVFYDKILLDKNQIRRHEKGARLEMGNNRFVAYLNNTIFYSNLYLFLMVVHLYMTARQQDLHGHKDGGAPEDHFRSALVLQTRCRVQWSCTVVQEFLSILNSVSERQNL